MSSTRHPAQARPLRQLDALFALLAVAWAMMGCDPGMPPIDASFAPDASVEDAAASRADGAAESDAGTIGEEDAGPDAGSTAPSCLAPLDADAAGTDSFVDGATARVTVDAAASCSRVYTLTSTATLRDGEPDNPRTVVELDGWPTTRTGHHLFDALHALALEEVRENSVAAVRDYAFDEGRAVSCGEGGCFETGRLWNYVWTRDTAYSVDLGLAAMDPRRARNSLEFKLSERRGGGNLQIVQDTGTGGSYPVSTDRVSWALGATTLLDYLSGDARTRFAARAFEAVRNTLEHDRRVIYDSTDGLYRGEQSFLDWREQTYPEWVEGDVVHVGMSKSLSTNLLHLTAMRLATRLAAEIGTTEEAARYAAWADALEAAIQSRFWLEEEGLFSTFVTTTLDPAATRRYDLLGSALAIVLDVATPSQALRILSRYPHYGPGAPVIWPQQQRTPIYHNRGEWPFVTAYWLRAAKHADHPAVADRMANALFRGAALNLSNMENFEAGSGEPWLEDGTASGPVVNSQRQLWSVAGYLAFVHETLFGLEAEADGLHVRPYVTASMRSGLFRGTDQLVLNDYPYRDHRITLVLQLPADEGAGALTVESMTLNGEPLSGDRLAGLASGPNVVEVILAPGSAEETTLTEADDGDYRNVFGPLTPRITGLSQRDGRVLLQLSTEGEAASDVTFRIYRDGIIVADELPGTTTSWSDPSSDTTGGRSPCYAVEQSYVISGNHSQHSPPSCWWGPSTDRIVSIGASEMAHVGGSASSNHGRFHYEGWGDPGHSLSVAGFSPAQSGRHLLQLVYGNGAGSESTGITCAVKRIVVEDEATGEVVAEGMVMMPHLADWSRWSNSSFVEADLDAARTYRIVIRGDDDMVNMSSFAHFESYTGGLGGRSGTFNRANVAELKILAL